jgi:hypothetical protein
LSSWAVGTERGVDGAGLGLGFDEEAIGGDDFIEALVDIGGLARRDLVGFCRFNTASFCEDHNRLGKII